MNADRLLVAGVIFLTILYLWIVRASYAPAIVVGEGRNQCLTGNDCGSAWECLWPCEAGHLWGTDDPDGWECLWPCPALVPKEWVQNYDYQDSTDCSTEAGAPPSTPTRVGSSANVYCNYTTWYYTSPESMDIGGEWLLGNYLKNTNASGELDFTGASKIYVEMVIRLIMTPGYLIGKTVIGQSLTSGTLVYPRLSYQAFGGIAGAEKFYLDCASAGPWPTAAIVTNIEPPQTYFVQMDFDTASGTQQYLRLYRVGLGLVSAEIQCTSQSTLSLDGWATGYIAGTGGVLNKMSIDQVRISNVPFGDPPY